MKTHIDLATFFRHRVPADTLVYCRYKTIFSGSEFRWATELADLYTRAGVTADTIHRGVLTMYEGEGFISAEITVYTDSIYGLFQLTYEK